MRYCVWTAIVLVVFGSVSRAQNDASTSPEELLKDTPLVPFPGCVIGLPDGPKKVKMLDLYRRQMLAIKQIAAARQPADAALLIPFLNYADNANDQLGAGQPAITEDLNQTKVAWPAFAALLSTPSAAAALKSYSLDKGNPVDYRLAAFCVLRYVDIDQFKNVSSVLEPEFNNAEPAVASYFKEMQRGNVRFWGVLFPDKKYLYKNRELSIQTSL